ncbi:hypothetical protein NDU88_000355 [Pleurodeles waltl]|uniref:Uncharacterized protein n=1 Tax=Pleurodeles waltl TaxID=8319 RepID=A0AAV7U3R7_PLEWA|nr:hypothetical protein NDU88_000355 [Pleurodeles waltl]
MATGGACAPALLPLAGGCPVCSRRPGGHHPSPLATCRSGVAWTPSIEGDGCEWCWCPGSPPAGRGLSWAPRPGRRSDRTQNIAARPNRLRPPFIFIFFSFIEFCSIGSNNEAVHPGRYCTVLELYTSGVTSRRNRVVKRISGVLTPGAVWPVGAGLQFQVPWTHGLVDCTGLPAVIALL